MKAFLLLTLLSLPALAGSEPVGPGEKLILACNSRGDALEGVFLVKLADGSSVIKVGHTKDDSDAGNIVYNAYLASGFKNIMNGVSDTLVGAKDHNGEWGGSRPGILLRISDGMKKGYLAEGGIVYDLGCAKKLEDIKF